MKEITMEKTSTFHVKSHPDPLFSFFFEKSLGSVGEFEDVSEG